MRTDHIFKELVGPRIRKLLRRHNRMIEEWNDEYPSSERDRLGYKEARFQTLLAQALDESKYDVIVQSYFDRAPLLRQSCDVFATKPNGIRRYWIEIKSQNVDRSGGYGGINLIRQVLCDIGKMKAGKSNGDRVVIWVGIWGSAKSVKACVKAGSSRLPFRIIVSPGRLRKLCACGRTSMSKQRVLKQLANCGSGSVCQALHELRRWIKVHGGKCEIIKATRGTDEKEEEWKSYGIFCGMMK